ncbi:Fimbrial protein [Polaromonas vacuolata]|uniref:Fimbrial protein n=1 Tax=Polaromonas vacuolata TaxID=37448 RepID=A0A6H2H8N0_9BURK|nr:type IV pilin protein [Polaromonas vacuolata]QJC55836.1 Fimbrial protein [Polaromonas vacuolata]
MKTPTKTLTKANRFTSNKGFTLIEVMLVMLILALLLTTAWPAYSAHIARGRRSDAKVQLASAQQWMERFYSENYSYAKDTAGNKVGEAFAAQSFSQSPRVGEGKAIYKLSVSSTDNSFILNATPTDGGPMTGDECGSLSLDHTGQRGISGTGERLKCWK